MMLFNPKVISKHIDKNVNIPPEHFALIESWIAQIHSGTLASLNEIEVHAPFTTQIMCKLLGYQAFGEGTEYNVAREYPIARGKVDLALGQFYGDKQKDTVFAPFELKGAKSNLDALMSGRHKTPVQQAFEYARDIRGAKWVLLSNYVELRLYSVADTSLVYEQFLFEDLLDPKQYARFQLLLNAENFLSGRTEQLLLESNNADKDISDKLYFDYKLLRQSMLSSLMNDNPEFDAEQLIPPAQKLLDRVLFISFAEDKGLIPNTSIKNAFEHQDPYNPRPVYQNFIGLFSAIDQGNKQLNIPAYNGGLFAKDAMLDALVVSDTLCEQFKDLAEYDFDSEVSVTVLGHIFEQSIADLEKLIAAIHAGELPEQSSKSRAVSGKRKKDGVVYTPDHITRFIVQNTLGSHIDEQFSLLFADYGRYKKDGTVQWKQGTKTELKFWYAWQQALKRIRVVDPACGSGAFMVAAFDYLYAEYEKSNTHIAELTGQRSVLDLNKQILNNNLFGVDINAESIEITKLSLWLKTAERGKPLASLDDNFIAGNSLGLDAPAPESEFSWKQAFKEVFAEGGFDVVLGNPPYVRQELLSDIKPWLEQHYAVYHGVLDLYGYFYELGIKLLKPGGRMAYISSSTFFKTGSGEKLRQYLSSKVCLEKIVDFGDIQVFEGVTTYPAILVLKNTPPSLEHKARIFKLTHALPDNLQTEFEAQHGVMAQRQLGTQSWQLEDERLHALRQKLVQDKPTLKAVYGSPYRGVLTGLNKAFVIDRITRDSIVARDPASAELIKPFLEGKDLKRWHSQPREIFLIFTRRGININDYPGIKQHLDPLRENLEPKPRDWAKGEKWSGRKAGPYKWYEIQDTVAYYEKFEKPKIQYGHFSPEPLFHCNTNGAYSNDKSYIIPSNDFFLLGLLNSSIYWFLIRSMCPFVRGGYYEVRAQYVETLAIPDKPEDEQISSLAAQIQAGTEQRYDIEQNFSRRLIDLCPENQPFKLNKKLQNWWQLDFPELQKEIKKSFKGSIVLAERNEWQDYFEAEQSRRAELNKDIASLEIELNQQVYRLFNLNDEEISLIEAAIGT